MTSEEREAHIRDVVDSAPLPSPEDIDRLRALLRLDTRAAASWSPGQPQSARPMAA
ncbi:hypothetical protein OG407_07390 [Streptomyces sp. NBC_01515]|uniref:hypothetical protein n=1 Tax=Streptomyces sp. NBC_01515 TaxID=2903890 RepID=UPI0038668E41